MAHREELERLDEVSGNRELAAERLALGRAAGRSRRLAFVVAGLCATLILALAVVLGVVVPRSIRAKVVDASRARGLVTTVGDVDLGLRGISLRDLHVQDAKGVLGASLAEVRVEGSPWALRRGIEGVDAVVVKSGRVRLRLEEQGLTELVQRLRGRSPGEPGSVRPLAPSASPRIALEGVRVSVDDAEGELLDASIASVSRVGAEVSARVERARIGMAPGDQVEIRDARVTLARTDRLRLSRVSVKDVAVRWGSGGDSTHVGGKGLVHRVQAARALVRAVLRRGLPREPEEAVGGWGARLEPDFGASVDALSIEGALVGHVADRLGFTEIEVLREGRDAVRLRGRGQGARVGSARWNLRIVPDALRAEGTLAVDAVPLSLIAPFVDDVPWYPSEAATVSANLDLRTSGGDAIDVRGNVNLDGFALSHPRLAATPIRDIHVRFEGEGTFHPLRRVLDVRLARAHIGSAQIDFVGVLERSATTFRIDGTWTLPPTPCDVAVHAIPADVLGPLVGLRLAGTIGGRAVLRIDSSDLDRTVFDVDVDDACAFTAVPPDADVARFAQPFVHQALEPDGTTFEMQTGPGTASWAALVMVSPLVPQAVISHEDAAFYRHHGFAPWAIRDALVRNLREGRYVVGASTITMQLVKNLFLHREKTLVRKIQEVLLTWWIEKSLSKDRILELYLNVIEYGPSIYGIRNATRHYFGREPIDVSPAEAAFLATILPSPKSYGAMYESGTISPAMKARITRFLRHMATQGRIGEAALAYGLAELENFRFHREGEELPEQRFFREDFSGLLAPEDVNGDATTYDSTTTDGWDFP